MSSNIQSSSLLDKTRAALKRWFTGNREELESLRNANHSLTQDFDAIIEAWALALEMSKQVGEGHIRRVTDMTVEMARRMGLTEGHIVHVRRGALLHDIGEMNVPDAILLKVDSLLPAERAILRKHPAYAYEMLSSIESLRPALDIPYCHHENWDGKGYPRGLKGEEIPLSARIFAVVDTYDAVRIDRPYRKAWSTQQTWDYLAQQAGVLFDPAVVSVFIETYKKS
ncbi:MAG: HD domain-containing protein [Chloroflexi bacterium]|nr:HD domain-containing protein [Chloroflexota bacterium]MCL5276069.1 HD domain-containing protein [Chloroflexota bacterium]